MSRFKMTASGYSLLMAACARRRLKPQLCPTVFELFGKSQEDIDKLSVDRKFWEEKIAGMSDDEVITMLAK